MIIIKRSSNRIIVTINWRYIGPYRDYVSNIVITLVVLAYLTHIVLLFSKIRSSLDLFRGSEYLAHRAIGAIHGADVSLDAINIIFDTR